jgi:hypothetical protein
VKARCDSTEPSKESYGSKKAVLPKVIVTVSKKVKELKISK